MSHDKISVVTLSKYGHITQSGLQTTSPTSQIPEANGVSKATKNKKRKHAKLQNQPNPRRPKKTICISYKDSLLPFSEQYANVPPNIFDEYGINRGVPTITFKNRLRQLTSAWALLFLLKKGYRVYIQRSDGKLYPCIYDMDTPLLRNMLLEYGHQYPSATICADADVQHGDRSHITTGTSVASGNIVILSKKYKQYKQDPNTMDALISALDSYNDNEKVSGTYKYNCFGHDFWVWWIEHCHWQFCSYNSMF
jgi:hypothetical protein